MEFSRPEYWSGWPFPSPGGLPNPGIEPRSPTLQADSLPAEPYGKPKNTGVGSLSLLQWIFLTQESNQGLLHCRQILYQLSYEGSPKSKSLCHVQLWDPMDCMFIEFSRPEYWSGYPFLSPVDLPNPEIEPRSPKLQADYLPAEPQGSPRTLEWVAYPFSSGSSWPRNRTGVSCIAGGFFTNWAMRDLSCTHKNIIIFRLPNKIQM